jgi:hypothetical protein
VAFRGFGVGRIALDADLAEEAEGLHLAAVLLVRHRHIERFRGP